MIWLDAQLSLALAPWIEQTFGIPCQALGGRPNDARITQINILDNTHNPLTTHPPFIKTACMTSQENILSLLRQQKKRFFEEYRLVKLGLFGSFARGDETEASDIDLIVEFAPGTEDLFGKKQQLREIVEQQFDRPVDVCREKYIKPYFRAQILQSAIFV